MGLECTKYTAFIKSYLTLVEHGSICHRLACVPRLSNACLTSILHLLDGRQLSYGYSFLNAFVPILPESRRLFLPLGLRV